MLWERKVFYSDMTEEEFALFCARSSYYRIEREADGTIVMDPPVFFESGFQENKVGSLLDRWNDSQQPKNGVVGGPNTGYRLPNGAIKAADASWISLDKLKTVLRESLKGFLAQCPEFIIEIRSNSDRLTKLKAKMLEWVENGVQLAWLIDPIEKQVFIYRENGSMDHVDNFKATLNGEGVLPNFELDLQVLEVPI